MNPTEDMREAARQLAASQQPASVVPFDESQIADPRARLFADLLIKDASVAGRNLDNNSADLIKLIARAYRAGATGQPLMARDLTVKDLTSSPIAQSARTITDRVHRLAVNNWLNEEEEYQTYLKLKERYE